MNQSFQVENDFLEKFINDRTKSSYNETRLKGNVEWYRHDKGFGVITVINEEKNKPESIFVYYTNIVHNTPLIPHLKTGETVEFNVFKSYYNNNLRYHAKDVTGLSGRKLLFEKHYDAQSREIIRTNRLVDETCISKIVPHMNVYESIPDSIGKNDVILLKNYFNKYSVNTILSEINEIHLNIKQNHGIWKLWHGNNHLIADDYVEWKSYAKLFRHIVDETAKLFSLDVKATRLNLYCDKDFKPFHQDAAAYKTSRAVEQNFSVTISFGINRSVIFKHNQTQTSISFDLPNGTIYAFGKNINLQWSHGVPPPNPTISENAPHDKERISIVLWGYRDQY